MKQSTGAAHYPNVLIVGCGRLGSLLAGQLSSLGSSVVVVDIDEHAFSRLPPEFSGFQVVGNAAELSVLRRARIEKADCVLAMAQQDNVNLMVAQVAKVVFGVPNVLARIYDPAREAVYREFGIETICPTTLSVGAFLSALGEQPEAMEP